MWDREKHYLWAAMMFYTRVPVPSSYEHSDHNFNQSRKYFPLIGVMAGLLAVLVVVVFVQFLPMSVSVALSMVATILFTGAFHEDGFADCCDGFGGGWDKTQVLTIMKDSRVGAYATIGMIMLLSLKLLTLIETGLVSVYLLALVLVNGHVLSRLGASVAIERLPYVQDIDKSKIKPINIASLSVTDWCVSCVFALPALVLLIVHSPQALVALPVMAVIHWLVCRYFYRRIGGYTGDCLGAMQQVLELVFNITVLAVV
jgi:adenosylcobinamide-GDP ribazoletransferase